MLCARQAQRARLGRFFHKTINGFATVAISGILVDTLNEMAIQISTPLVDLKAIRRQYHSAKLEQMKDGQRRLLPTRPKRHNDKLAASTTKGHTPNAGELGVKSRARIRNSLRLLPHR